MGSISDWFESSIIDRSRKETEASKRDAESGSQE